MKIDLAFERIDHLLRNSVRNFRFIGCAEKRNAYLATLKLDAALERHIGLDGTKARCTLGASVDRQDSSGSKSSVKITRTVHFEPAQCALGRDARLNETPGCQSQQWPRRRIGLRKAQRDRVCNTQPAEQSRERLATLHARFS